MNVSLTPELEDFVTSKVESGRYRSASEVVREALRLLEEQDGLRAVHLEELRRAIQVGVDQLDRGEGVGHSKESLRSLMDEIKRRGRERLAAEGKTAGE